MLVHIRMLDKNAQLQQEAVGGALPHDVAAPAGALWFNYLPHGVPCKPCGFQAIHPCFPSLFYNHNKTSTAVLRQLVSDHVPAASGLHVTKSMRY